MRFGAMFTRDETTVGADTIDVAKDFTAQLAATKACSLSQRATSINGFPGQRICVAYSSPSATDTAADLYLWDDLTKHWYVVNPTPVALKSGHIAYFDTPTFGDAPGATDSKSQGSMTVILITAAIISPPAGTYTFAMGTDISSPGV